MLPPPIFIQATIYQGATFRLWRERQRVPYAVTRNREGILTAVATGLPVPPEDITDEDYSGCQARMQIRTRVDAPDVLLDCTTEDGRIVLAGRRIQIELSDADTSGLFFETAIGHVEIIRPNGDVERQYEIEFRLSPEGTR